MSRITARPCILTAPCCTASRIITIPCPALSRAQSDLFNRCATDGVPEAPARFQCIPWAETSSGDLLKFKDPVNKVGAGPGGAGWARRLMARRCLLRQPCAAELPLGMLLGGTSVCAVRQGLGTYPARDVV